MMRGLNIQRDTEDFLLLITIGKACMQHAMRIHSISPQDQLMKRAKNESFRETTYPEMGSGGAFFSFLSFFLSFSPRSEQVHQRMTFEGLMETM